MDQNRSEWLTLDSFVFLLLQKDTLECQYLNVAGISIETSLYFIFSFGVDLTGL